MKPLPSNINENLPSLITLYFLLDNLLNDINKIFQNLL